MCSSDLDGITISLWFRWKSGGTSYGGMLRFGVSTSISAGQTTEWRVFESSGSLTFAVYDGSNSESYVSSSAPYDDLWHHYSWSIASGTSSHSWTIYIDNIKKVCPSGCSSSKAKGITAKTDTTDYYYFIGKENSVTPSSLSDRFFDGYIDDLRIYKGVLTDAQVKTLYERSEEHTSELQVTRSSRMPSSA